MRHDYIKNGIAADATGRTLIGFAQAHKYGGTIVAKDVVVEQEGASDADWNIEVDGDDVFSGEKSVSSADAPEEFHPDQNREAGGAYVPLHVSVSVASGTTGSTLNVSVSIDDGKDS